MNKETLIKEINKPENFNLVVSEILKIMGKDLIYKKTNLNFNNQDVVKQYLMLNFSRDVNESFCCMFLDNKNVLIKTEKLFFGTINQCGVYPRVVVQRALALNSVAVIFFHNHPSGNLKPSNSDKDITLKLVEALKLVDVRVLDHFIVTKEDTFSFAQNGLI